MKIINREELKKLMDGSEELVLIDVRDSESYYKGHILHSINIQLENLESWGKKYLYRDERVVVYCGGFECTLSPKAAEELTKLGFNNIWDYEGGFKDWQDAEYLVEYSHEMAVGE